MATADVLLNWEKLLQIKKELFGKNVAPLQPLLLFMPEMLRLV